MPLECLSFEVKRLLSADRIPCMIAGSAITISVQAFKSPAFDFTVRSRYIDTALYATYPIPRSLHASLNWYFLN